MAYRHTGKTVVISRNDPIDPQSTDWVYFGYADWLRENEEIISHSALIDNGTIVTDSTYLAAITDTDGVEHTHVYAVQITPGASGTVTVTHRVSTRVTSGADLARLNIDHSIAIPITTL